MTKTIFLLRHGETFFNLHDKIQGVCDSPLTELGEKQAGAVRQYFAKHKIHFAHAFASPQERACDTLEIVLGEDFPYKRLKELKEKNYGIFEGADAYLVRADPNWRNDDQSMERNSHVVQRMKLAMTKILAQTNDGETSLVVGHGDSLGQFVKTINKSFSAFGNCDLVELLVQGKKIEYIKHISPAKNIK